MVESNFANFTVPGFHVSLGGRFSNDMGGPLDHSLGDAEDAERQEDHPTDTAAEAGPSQVNAAERVPSADLEVMEVRRSDEAVEQTVRPTS